MKAFIEVIFFFHGVGKLMSDVYKNCPANEEFNE
jgi:hypothetical protein